MFCIYKYIATKKFKELTAMDNYEGLGQDTFQALERGEEVEIKEPSEKLIEDGYIEKKESK